MREMGRIEEDSISPTTVDRMVSYMARHEGDKQGQPHHTNATSQRLTAPATQKVRRTATTNLHKGRRSTEGLWGLSAALTSPVTLRISHCPAMD